MLAERKQDHGDQEEHGQAFEAFQQDEPGAGLEDEEDDFAALEDIGRDQGGGLVGEDFGVGGPGAGVGLGGARHRRRILQKGHAFLRFAADVMTSCRSVTTSGRFR